MPKHPVAILMSFSEVQDRGCEILELDVGEGM